MLHIYNMELNVFGIGSYFIVHGVSRKKSATCCIMIYLPGKNWIVAEWILNTIFAAIFQLNPGSAISF